MSAKANEGQCSVEPVRFNLEPPVARAVKSFTELVTGQFIDYSSSTHLLVYIALTTPHALRNSVNSMMNYVVAEGLPLDGDRGLSQVIDSRLRLATKQMEAARRATQ